GVWRVTRPMMSIGAGSARSANGVMSPTRSTNLRLNDRRCDHNYEPAGKGAGALEPHAHPGRGTARRTSHQHRTTATGGFRSCENGVPPDRGAPAHHVRRVPPPWDL